MRISGLATGMDTEKIIADLMKAQRLPIDKMTQKKQYMQWQMDDYRKTNRDLRATSDKVFDTVMKQSTFMEKNVNLSNDKALSIKNVNATSDFAGTIKIHQLATQSTLQSSQLGDLGSNKVTNNTTLESLGETGDFKLTINAPGMKKPIDLTFDKSTKIETVISEMNKKTGVNAFFDEVTGKIAITAKESGKDAITVSGDIANLLKLDSSNTVIGKNAVFTFNGLKTERNSNTFQINGFEMNLKQVTAPLLNGIEISETEPVIFNSVPNVDKVVESVKQFVDDYNKLIEDLNSKIREPKYRNFQPLSEEQKKDMKENEIKLWEEKAMSGTLRNDSEISSMITKLRTMMSSSIQGSDGNPISLKDIGVTQMKSYTDNGKLEINESELRTAISDNPNKVYELFASPSEKGDNSVDVKKGGLATQFKSIIDDTRGVISKKAGTTGSVSESFTMGRTMKEMNTQITKFEDRLKMVESRYWKQFNAMENAIQRANAQSASLMSALGGGA